MGVPGDKWAFIIDPTSGERRVQLLKLSEADPVSGQFLNRPVGRVAEVAMINVIAGCISIRQALILRYLQRAREMQTVIKWFAWAHYRGEPLAEYWRRREELSQQLSVIAGQIDEQNRLATIAATTLQN